MIFAEKKFEKNLRLDPKKVCDRWELNPSQKQAKRTPMVGFEPMTLGLIGKRANH